MCKPVSITEKYTCQPDFLSVSLLVSLPVRHSLSVIHCQSLSLDRTELWRLVMFLSMPVRFQWKGTQLHLVQFVLDRRRDHKRRRRWISIDRIGRFPCFGSKCDSRSAAKPALSWEELEFLREWVWVSCRWCYALSFQCRPGMVKLWILVPLPLPQKCSYFICSYPSHECGRGWPGLPLPHPWGRHRITGIFCTCFCDFLYLWNGIVITIL